MRGMSQNETDRLTTLAQSVKVLVVDMSKASAVISKQLQEMGGGYEGKEYEYREKTLAIIVGTTFVTDDECCFYEGADEGIKLDVYRKGEDKFDENGNKTGSSVFMFPTGTVTMTLEDLEAYKKEETTLDVFCGDRFLYNKRCVGNFTFMLDYIKKAK